MPNINDKPAGCTAGLSVCVLMQSYVRCTNARSPLLNARELVESGLYSVDFVADGFELGFFFGAVFAEVFEAFEQAVGLKARGGLSGA